MTVFLKAGRLPIIVLASFLITISSTWSQSQPPAQTPSPATPAAPSPAGQAPQPAAQQTAPSQATPPQRREVSVRADKGIYRGGERPRISGRMLAGVGTPATGFVRVRVYELNQSEKSPVRYDNIVEVKAGDFTDDGFVVQTPHERTFQWSTVQVRYFIQVLGITDAPEAQWSVAGTELLVQEVGIGEMITFLFGPVASLIYVLIMVHFAFLKPPTRPAVKIMLTMTYSIALVFLAVPFLAPLLISSSSDLEALLRTTPVGFLKAPVGTSPEMQWVVNVGGVVDSAGALKGGVAIPLLVLVLSMVGAGINMLRKLPDFLKTFDALPETTDKDIPSAGQELRTDLFRYFVYILGAPFIAMAAYSLMNIADYTNPNALMVVAFSVGFISDAVVEAIVKKTSTLLGK